MRRHAQIHAHNQPRTYMIRLYMICILHIILCIHTRSYTFIHTNTHMFTHSCIHTYTRTRTYGCILTYTRTYTHECSTQACIQTQNDSYSHTHIHTHTLKYKHTHTHTNAHTHTHTRKNTLQWHTLTHAHTYTYRNTKSCMNRDKFVLQRLHCLLPGLTYCFHEQRQIDSRAN